MHPDIKSAISLIDHQISELQRAKKILLETFGSLDKATEEVRIKPSTSEPARISRRDEIIKALKESGPLSRGEIHEKTEIPLGTIATVLNNKEAFINKGGKWRYIENPFLEEGTDRK